jgi:hypothetical protein
MIYLITIIQDKQLIYLTFNQNQEQFILKLLPTKLLAPNLLQQRKLIKSFNHKIQDMRRH